MFKIAKWFNNYKAPSVLMIDDLSDAYVEVYEESHKNDWGYFCNKEDSSFQFLQKNLLALYPEIKITFFVPYLRHNVINDHSKFTVKKFALGEREEYTHFLKQLNEQGHEISHHGSNHGEYFDDTLPTTVNNWTHEWALFDDVDTAVNITMDGVKKFKSICNIDVVGGKYCGYIAIENSREIIDKCDFLYWCEGVNYDTSSYNDTMFGQNDIISFPTTIAGNSFVRLSYLTGNAKKDKQKKILKYFQPLYNILSYINIYKFYRKGHIISIQEHYSPSTTSGMVQSANIVSDIKSLQKTFSFLQKLSIWYASCKEIASYIYIQKNTTLAVSEAQINIIFNNNKKIDNSIISITNSKSFTLKKEGDNQSWSSELNNKLYVVNVPIQNGNNVFTYLEKCEG